MSSARSPARLVSAGAAFCAILLAAPSGRAAVSSLEVFGMAFGAYDAAAPGGSRAAATVRITTDSGLDEIVSVSLGPSLNTGSTAPRRLKHVARESYLDYLLTLEGAAGPEVVSVSVVVPPGAPLNVGVEGAIPPGQSVHPGDYADRVTVTVDW